MGVKLTNEMITGAQEAESKYGIPASITLAQIVLESGGGKGGGLSKLAANYNNLFGQKAGKNESGVTLQTTEYIQGKPVPSSAKFKVYDSVAESIDDHGKKWGVSRVGQQNSIEEYADALVKEGYATDPSYSSLLLSIIKDRDLTQYDSGKSGVTTTYDQSEEKGLTGKIKEAVKPIIKLLALLVIAFVGVVFFMKAFDMDAPKLPIKGGGKK